MKIIAKNKQAFRDYEIIKEYEAGIVLEGWEVKSIKSGALSLRESYVTDEKGELWVYGMHVAKWKFSSNTVDYNETRKRKLLLHRKEIDKLALERQRAGLTVVMLDIHLVRGKVKCTIALCKGKREFEKRMKIKEKDQKRVIEQDLKKAGY